MYSIVLELARHSRPFIPQTLKTQENVFKIPKGRLHLLRTITKLSCMPNKKKNFSFPWLVLGTLFFLGCVGLGLYQKWRSASGLLPAQVVQEKEGYSPTPVALGGPFTLTDHHGKKRSSQEFLGKVMVIYFGYSYCPDICPMALNNLTAALEMLSHNQRHQLQPLFITIDPERDTVSHLKSYVEGFHPQLIGLTGSQSQLNSVLNSFKVFARRQMDTGTHSDYLMDHSSIVYVMDRQGHFVTSFNHLTEPEKIKEVLINIL
jgi:cytochrome oxidase Cu insertion factor (SCO1/SenC/PrrC family)